jgi:hypothetical protein
MAASYPGSVRSFTTKVNNIDIIDAAHPNVLQEEVVAIESTLGVNPQISSGISGTYISAGTTFSSVSARLDNIEKGITGDTHAQYIKTTGGATITASSASTVPLTVQGVASQSANLQEWKNSAGAVVAAIGPTGSLTDSGAVVEHDNLYVISWVFG